MQQLQSLVSRFAAFLHAAAHASADDDGEDHGRTDSALTVQVLRSMAESGDPDAQFSLGWMYDIGEGVAEDHEQALLWYRRAATQGIAQAQASVGVMHALGRGVVQDSVRAHMWFSLAASSGDARAAEYRDIIEESMPPDRIGEARSLARAWAPGRTHFNPREISNPISIPISNPESLRPDTAPRVQ